MPIVWIALGIATYLLLAAGMIDGPGLQTYTCGPDNLCTNDGGIYFRRRGR